MSKDELWNYMKKVRVDNGQNPPQPQKLEKLLNLPDAMAKNVLWDVIIHSPTHVNSFIDRLVNEELELARTASTNRNANGIPQKKRRRRDNEPENELEKHLKRLGFTSDALPTLEMAQEAHFKAMSQECIRFYEFSRDAPMRLYKGDGMIKAKLESDDTKEAYTESLQYIKAAIAGAAMLAKTEQTSAHGSRRIL